MDIWVGSIHLKKLPSNLMLAVAYQVKHKTAILPGISTPQFHAQTAFISLTAHSSLTHVSVKS